MDQAEVCILLNAMYIMEDGNNHTRRQKSHYIAILSSMQHSSYIKQCNTVGVIYLTMYYPEEYQKHSQNIKSADQTY